MTILYMIYALFCPKSALDSIGESQYYQGEKLIMVFTKYENWPLSGRKEDGNE